MIQKYVNKLIKNLPEDTKKNEKIDLILDGGIFNGSYLIGALYFLKEMEKRKYLQIERISGCSIGAVVGFLYYIDSLDLMPMLYKKVKKELKENLSLSLIKNIKKHIEHRIPENICEKVNGKLFICYNNIHNKSKTVKSHYTSVDDIIETIICSCYIPFLIDGNILYKNKYIDGINAFVFENEPNKKILHMELLSYDKIMYSLNIQNEKSNFHRILHGLLDIHSFYVKKTNTPMCSYVNGWNLVHKSRYQLKLFLEKMIVYFIHIILYIQKYIPEDIKNSFLIKVINKILIDVYALTLETYFV